MMQGSSEGSHCIHPAQAVCSPTTIKIPLLLKRQRYKCTYFSSDNSKECTEEVVLIHLKHLKGDSCACQQERGENHNGEEFAVQHRSYPPERLFLFRGADRIVDDLVTDFDLVDLGNGDVGC